METDQDAIGREITCVSCGQKFIPLPPAVVPIRHKRMRLFAKVVMWLAGALALISLLIFIGAFFTWHRDAAAAHGEDSFPFFAVAYSFLKATIVLYLVATVTHTRANTEK